MAFHVDLILSHIDNRICNEPLKVITPGLLTIFFTNFRLLLASFEVGFMHMTPNISVAFC
jgi:hypothetical protein